MLRRGTLSGLGRSQTGGINSCFLARLRILIHPFQLHFCCHFWLVWIFYFHGNWKNLIRDIGKVSQCASKFFNTPNRITSRCNWAAWLVVIAPQRDRTAFGKNLLNCVFCLQKIQNYTDIGTSTVVMVDNRRWERFNGVEPAGIFFQPVAFFSVELSRPAQLSKHQPSPVFVCAGVWKIAKKQFFQKNVLPSHLICDFLVGSLGNRPAIPLEMWSVAGVAGVVALW
jgi:hypothetical protein